MATRGVRWLALGDVNTIPGEGVRTYVDLARAEAEALGLVSAEARGGPEWTSAEIMRAAGSEDGAGVVSVMIGTFDHAVDPGRGGPRVPLSEFRENMREALRAVSGWEGLGRRPDGGPCIIVMTPPFCTTGIGRTGLELSQERLSRYCAALLEIAEEFDAVPVDINTIFGGSVRWSDDRLRRVWTEYGDGLTLNSIAHRLIYPYVRGALKACVVGAGS